LALDFNRELNLKRLKSCESCDLWQEKAINGDGRHQQSEFPFLKLTQRPETKIGLLEVE